MSYFFWGFFSVRQFVFNSLIYSAQDYTIGIHCKTWYASLNKCKGQEENLTWNLKLFCYFDLVLVNSDTYIYISTFTVRVLFLH